ncbi:MAG: DTW domain-containing protein [Acidovorax soli]|nr:tRNA-uridine aminocarboxypropyltransferase [Acidovorax soli]MCM2347934.1 DTW domain-containing protein [Acidovorax soli]
MVSALHASRPRCPACLRPHSACICRWVTPVAHRTEVLILQHPLEVHEAKGTARLLHLSLPHSRLLTGEQWDPGVLQPLLTAPWGTPAPSVPPRRALLLYPEAPQDAALGLAAPPPLDPAWLPTPQGLRLVVLDGTWRKSRKMLHRNPLLQQLPRLPLLALPASRYRIRIARQPHQLSTLEATCAALAQLEADAERFAPLLAAFDGFVAQQAGWQGR